MLDYVIIVLGLCLFEIISSIDNAVVNADVLSTMEEKYRKIFLFWGILFAVFVVRGVLPFLIVWIANTDQSVTDLFGAAFSGDAQVEESLEKSKPYLLLAGGTYLFFVFLSWLFLEEKKYAFLVESFIHRQGVWFYAVSSILTTLLVFLAVQTDPYLALAATIGVSAFFITDGFKKNAAEKERQLMDPNMSAWSKIIYLEVLDISFSIDGVIGAFAFTLLVPLILIGNGIGAFVVREFTVRGVHTIKKYAYLKNGAMYSIGMLGGLMMIESFGQEFPFWIAPLNTFSLLGIFTFLSYKEIRAAGRLAPQEQEIEP